MATKREDGIYIHENVNGGYNIAALFGASGGSFVWAGTHEDAVKQAERMKTYFSKLSIIDTTKKEEK